MQSAKDTFLMALRGRLTAINPARTVVVRGAMRPAVLTEENELAAADPLDCFVLRWLSEQRDATEPSALHALSCEIRYTTRGMQEFAGMDRGRVLSAIDAELGKSLLPRWAGKTDYAAATPAMKQTRVFWSEREPAVVTTEGDRLQAVSKVTVYALEEVEV